MVKFITLGNYYKKYRYIIFYILLILPLEYFLSDAFPDEMKIKYLRSDNFPSEILVYEVFKYFGIFIFGLIVLKIEIESLFTGKKIPEKNKTEGKSEIELIYYNKETPYISVVPVFILLCLFIIEIKMMSFFYFIFGFLGLDFWMLEIIFIFILNIILFKNKIYFHQKFAIAIILIFSTIMKIISIILIYESDDPRIYKKYSWLLPLGIIGFALLYLIDAYAWCKMKWYFDLKFISEKKC